MYLQLVVLSLIIHSSFCYTADEYLEHIQNFQEGNKDYVSPKNNNEYLPINNEITDNNDVDFIVVGSGTAGSIVAKRLSENESINIMVIEAGTYAHPVSDISGLGGMVMNSPYEWGYRSKAKNRNCFDVKDGEIYVLRGKGFGGTGIFSGMRYIRSSKNEWDALAEQGHQGWDYNTMLNYFKKAENSSLFFEDLGYHGYLGPLPVENAKENYGQENIISEGFKEINLNKVDFNGKEQLGVGPVQLLSQNGVRYHSGKGYTRINLIRNKTNVILADKALALKIIIDPSTQKASCVIFSQNKKLYKVCAKKEIILSAGAINTPQLLMLSGIGPQEDLVKLNIPVIKNAPVGQQLMDHPTILFGYVNFDTKNFSLPVKTRKEHLIDFVNGKGEYTVAGGNRMLSFHKSKYTKPNEGADIMGVFSLPFTSNLPNKNTSEFDEDVFEALYNKTNLLSAVKINILLTNPSSRGSVTLKSNSPFDYPVINLNVLSHFMDLNVYLEGVKILLQLVNSETFKNVGAKLVEHILPNCKKYEYLSDNYWKCFAKEINEVGCHLYNTCPMGLNPENAVVDSNLNVYGVHNLRIVDASVITKLSGYPMANIIAIAEKASDIIKKTYQI